MPRRLGRTPAPCALRTSVAATFALAAACPGAAFAVQAPPGAAAGPSLEVAAGPPLRLGRRIGWHRPPRGAERRWHDFVVDLAPGWTAMWDEATRVPLRMWGPGIEATSVMQSPATAELFARSVLARHVALLAPGSQSDDFVLVANDFDGSMRTLGFRQIAAGMEVLGGQVSFRFKNGRLFAIGSDALPHVNVRAPRVVVPAAGARAAAKTWILAGGAASASAQPSVEGPFVLPLVDAGGVREHRTVLRVVVDATGPIGRWNVYVDAETGEPVARGQALRFTEGTLRYNAPIRYPLAERFDYPAAKVKLSVNGSTLTSGIDGLLVWDGDAPASVEAKLSGPAVTVKNAAGDEAQTVLSVAPGGSAVWNEAQSELDDAQIAAYVHTERAKQYAKSVAPALQWLNQQAVVTVNIDDACNAFSDGNTTNFFRAKFGCENTGRIADVVYHELGHSIHAHAVIPGVGAFEEALSEGISDYFATTITGDSGMGRGFMFSDDPLRELDPPNGEYVWPDDNVGESHATGLIIGGALWDLRKALVAKLGEEVGVAQADHLWFEGIRRASDIPTMYPEVLAADDDDGDISNGTPNVCEINKTFAAHGLRAVVGAASAAVLTAPEQEGFLVTLTLSGLFEQCPSDAVTTADLEWRLRGIPGVGGTIPMLPGGAGTLTAEIPKQPDGHVVQYSIQVHFVDGSSRVYPDNLADPRYEMFVGPVTPIYCTDFETDPFASGWAHGLTSGKQEEGADDWHWGLPGKTEGSGDPSQAFSGERVIGNDLGGGNYNGLYKPDKVNYALSPVVDTKGHEYVRLQFRRWLAVEDGYFDRASIYANGTLVWSNLNSKNGEESDTHHRDLEWRFQDVDLTPYAKGGSIQIKYELASDAGLEMSGWNIDDFCVVSFTPPVAVCGDGIVQIGEACDEGPLNSDVTPDACRADCTMPACGDGVVDSLEECDPARDQASATTCTAQCKLAPQTGGAGGGEPSAQGDLDPVDASGCGCRAAGGDASRRSARAASLAGALWLATTLLRRRRRGGRRSVRSD